MNDEIKRAIVAELLGVADLYMLNEVPAGAMPIEECVAALRDQYPGLGMDRAVKIVKEAVKAGKIKFVRSGSKKYYYKA